MLMPSHKSNIRLYRWAAPTAKAGRRFRMTASPVHTTLVRTSGDIAITFCLSRILPFTQLPTSFTIEAFLLLAAAVITVPRRASSVASA